MHEDGSAQYYTENCENTVLSRMGNCGNYFPIFSDASTAWYSDHRLYIGNSDMGEAKKTKKMNIHSANSDKICNKKLY